MMLALWLWWVRNSPLLCELCGPADSKQRGQSDSNTALQHIDPPNSAGCDSLLFMSDVNISNSSNSWPQTKSLTAQSTRRAIRRNLLEIQALSSNRQGLVWSSRARYCVVFWDMSWHWVKLENIQAACHNWCYCISTQTSVTGFSTGCEVLMLVCRDDASWLKS